MNKYYDLTNERLIFLGARAKPSFWDNLWTHSDLTSALESASHERFVTGITQRFLPPSRTTRILEAGCGRGELVLALRHAGYDACGVDFAPRTIARTLQLRPDLPLTVADVTKLPYPDRSFDGYWSLGVIEHSFQGYAPILREMSRVLKPNGYSFITFPYLSWLRRLKVRLGAYTPFPPESSEPSNFYQYAFSRHQVQMNIERLGFTLRSARAVDGFKGLKDELRLLSPLLCLCATSRLRLFRALASALNEAAAPWAGHIMLLVMQKHS